MVSISVLHSHIAVTESLELERNLCLIRWLKLSLMEFNNITTLGWHIEKVGFCCFYETKTLPLKLSTGVFTGNSFIWFISIGDIIQ